jgi:hypothetical protein
MKSTQLPPVRVELAVREEIESCLRDGETLSQFIEQSAVQAARARKSQQQFLARGRASLVRAQRNDEFYPAADVLGEMRARLQTRMGTLKKKRASNAV